jgi:hypothetical protein
LQIDQKHAENELDGRGYDENVKLSVIQRNTAEVWGEGKTNYRTRWIHSSEQKLKEGRNRSKAFLAGGY